jgi:hypothetical protein
MILKKKNGPAAADPKHVKTMRIWHRRLREPMLTLLLAIQIFMLFVVPTIHAAGFIVPHVFIWAIFLTFVTLATIASRSKTAIVIMMISVSLTIFGTMLRHEDATLSTDLISTVGQVLTQLSLLWVVSSAVFGPGRTSHHRILGAVVMYLCIGMVFTSLDIFLAKTIPGAFTHIATSNVDLRETMTYFSFGTLTTGTFGDILPVHPIARSLANMESICGQLFPATLLARIVSIHSLHQDKTG